MGPATGVLGSRQRSHPGHSVRCSHLQRTQGDGASAAVRKCCSAQMLQCADAAGRGAHRSPETGEDHCSMQLRIVLVYRDRAQLQNYLSAGLLSFFNLRGDRISESVFFWKKPRGSPATGLLDTQTAVPVCQVHLCRK